MEQDKVQSFPGYPPRTLSSFVVLSQLESFVRPSKMITAFNLASLLGAALVNAYPNQQLHTTTYKPTHPDLTACSSIADTLQYSCENTTVVENSCCSVTRGGFVLQPQFWWTWTGLEDEGQLLPKNSWTIHGLLAYNCDGFIYST